MDLIGFYRPTMDERNAYFDILVEQSGNQHFCPTPFLSINTENPYEAKIQQISSDFHPPQVFIDLCLDIDTIQQRASLESVTVLPRVVCWTDISSHSLTTARDTVTRSLRSEYYSLFHSLKHSLSPDFVSFEKPLSPVPSDRFFIYHFVDPSPDHIRNPKTTISFRSPPNSPKDSLPMSSLEQTFHIYDCSGAARLLAKAQDQINAGFAATEDLLVCPSKLPYALLTACLLTPGQVALLWQAQKYSDFGSGLLTEIDILSFIDLLIVAPESGLSLLRIIENVLEVIADQIAMEVILKTAENGEKLFFEVFRTNPLKSRLFYRYLFATRVLRSVSMKPVCLPELPSMNEHLLWSSFDLQVDRALYGIKESVKPSPRPSRFEWKMILEDALQHLELWMSCTPAKRRSPRELGFLPVLLENENTFARALSFVANFLKSSEDRMREFLLTRSFPVLINRIINVNEFSEDVKLDLMIVITTCCTGNSELANFGKDNPSWFDFLNSFVIDAIITNDDVFKIVVALGCLLLFEQRDVILQENDKILMIIASTTEHEDSRIRCLSHLLLAECKIPFLRSPKFEEENDPLVRAAMIIRADEQLRNSDLGNSEILDLQQIIAERLSDMSRIVRTEAIIAVALGIISNRFGNVRQLLIQDDKSKLSSFLRDGITGSSYDPSSAIQNNLAKLISLIDMPSNKSLQPQSAFKSAVLLHFAHSPETEIPIQHFRTDQLKGSNCCGHPAISPSGILSCVNNGVKLYTQSHDREVVINLPLFDEKIDLRAYRGLKDFKLPSRFSTQKQSTSATFLRSLDDDRVMAISNSWQVCIVDPNIPDFASFWINPVQGECNSTSADYNFFNGSLIHASNGVRFSDLHTMRAFGSCSIPARSVAWVKWHPDLFIAANPTWALYDARTLPSVIIVGAQAENNVIGCNSCAFVPSWFLIGTSDGTIKLWDIRMPSPELQTKRPFKSLKAFDIHAELPFAVGHFDNDLHVMEYSSGKLNSIKMLARSVDGFSIHPAEPRVAIRTRDLVYIEHLGT
jgi:hypothetical protein